MPEARTQYHNFYNLIGGKMGNITEKSVQSHSLPCNLHAGEISLFAAYLLKLSARKSDSTKVIFTKGEYQQLVGVKEIRLEQLNKYILHFMENDILIDDGYPLFEEARLEKNGFGEWEVTLQGNNLLKEWLFNLAESRDRMRYTLKLKSKYSKRLYWQLKDNVWNGTWEAALKELRELLDINAPRYDSFKYLNVEILKKCEEEINSNTDIRFSYEKIQRGRTTTAVNFFITSIEEYESVKGADPREKYIVNLRLDGELKDPIIQAAYEMGLPITKFIDLAVREKLERMKENEKF